MLEIDERIFYTVQVIFSAKIIFATVYFGCVRDAAVYDQIHTDDPIMPETGFLHLWSPSCPSISSLLLLVSIILFDFYFIQIARILFFCFDLCYDSVSNSRLTDYLQSFIFLTTFLSLSSRQNYSNPDCVLISREQLIPPVLSQSLILKTSLLWTSIFHPILFTFNYFEFPVIPFLIDLNPYYCFAIPQAFKIFWNVRTLAIKGQSLQEFPTFIIAFIVVHSF